MAVGTAGKFTREDQVNISVTLDGVPYQGWDSISGGAADSNTVKIRVNGKEIDIGGPGTRGDVTVGIQMSDVVMGWSKTFDGRRGKGVATVGWQILDADLNVLAGKSYTGTLKGCTDPDFDKMNSSPGAAKFTITVSCNEDLA